MERDESDLGFLGPLEPPKRWGHSSRIRWECNELGFGHLVSVNVPEDTNGLIEAEIFVTMT